jgi:alpha-galactosidase
LSLGRGFSRAVSQRRADTLGTVHPDRIQAYEEARQRVRPELLRLLKGAGIKKEFIRMRTIVLVVLAGISSLATAGAASIDVRDGWQATSNTFSYTAAAMPGAGFSFNYDGKTVGPVFGNEWKLDVHEAHGSSEMVLTHESGLVVTRHMRVFGDFNAIEYSLRFKNTSNRILPAVAFVRWLDLSFDHRVLEGSCVISSGGGTYSSMLPPSTFDIRKSCFAPTTPVEGYIVDGVHLTTQGGRSSDKDLPFFFIQNDAHQEGLFVAFGWSGQWSALVGTDNQQNLKLLGWIPDINIALEPGEEIQGPTILLGSYKGALVDGSNRLRRLIRDAYTPKLGGKSFLPVVTYDHWFGVYHRFDEPLLRKLADGAASIGQEYFLLDAGWYAGTNDEEGFAGGTGNWEEVDRVKLPNGLKPVADYVRSKSLKFGLWFEPERVQRGTLLARQHPDWVLWNRDQELDPWWCKLFPGDYGVSGLLDYSRPEVQQWVRDMLDHYINDLGIRYIRYDFNLDPLPYWNAKDLPNRRGITQLRHIQGFYAVIDWIRARHPETVLEGCASGGNRIDLETARRFHTFWISDHTLDPAVVRFHLFGINYFLPGNYHYATYILPQPNQPNFQADDLGFQSFFGGAFGTGGRVDLWPEGMKQKARLHVETYKKIRRYLMGDYYPLSVQPGDLESWSGWQFQDPVDGSGFVETFRTKTRSGTHRFILHKLDKQARYRFTDPYTAESVELTGATAMASGIEIRQTPMSARVLIYSRIRH